MRREKNITSKSNNLLSDVIKSVKVEQSEKPTTKKIENIGKLKKNECHKRKNKKAK